jgi:aspartyl-tRNA(Asn)/glutamyl-tRNA(Gln) amidotransferase subunit C
MKLSLEQVEHVAELAKLALSPEEKERYREQLSQILDYADTLQALDVQDIPPTAHALNVSNVLRRDVPDPCYPVDEILANAPDMDDDQFRVPAILE